MSKSIYCSADTFGNQESKTNKYCYCYDAQKITPEKLISEYISNRIFYGKMSYNAMLWINDHFRNAETCMDYEFLYDLRVSINKEIYKEENLCNNIKVILEYITETAYMHNIKNNFNE